MLFLFETMIFTFSLIVLSKVLQQRYINSLFVLFMAKRIVLLPRQLKSNVHDNIMVTFCECNSMKVLPFYWSEIIFHFPIFFFYKNLSLYDVEKFYTKARKIFQVFFPVFYCTFYKRANLI